MGEYDGLRNFFDQRQKFDMAYEPARAFRGSLPDEILTDWSS